VPFAPVASFAPVVAVIPAVTEDNARFDPLQFLRAAAIENLRS